MTKRYAWGVFTFVSLWFTYWVFFTKRDGIPELTRYAIVYAVTTATLVGAYYLLYRYYRTTFKRKHSKLAALISRVFKIHQEPQPQGAGALEGDKAGGTSQAEPYTTVPLGDPPSKTECTLIGLVLSVLSLYMHAVSICPYKCRLYRGSSSALPKAG